jgi:hypothetical protein
MTDGPTTTTAGLLPAVTIPDLLQLSSSNDTTKIISSNSTHLDDPLVFFVASGHLIASNCLAWLLYGYLKSLPTLSQNILNQLSTSLILAYNFNITIMSLSLILRSTLGPLPELLTSVCIFVLGFGFFCLVGHHIAVAVIRYCIVVCFSWIHMQDHRAMSMRISLIVSCVSLVLVSVIFIVRDPENSSVGIEAYLAGKPAHETKLRLTLILLAFPTLVGLIVFYLVCKCILHMREARRIQPVASGSGAPALSRHIDVKSIIIGSFYILACCGQAIALDDHSTFRNGIALTILWLHLNIGVLIIKVSGSEVRAFLKLRIKQLLCRRRQICQDFDSQQAGCGLLLSVMNSATRLLRSIGRTIRVAPTMNDVIV